MPDRMAPNNVSDDDLTRAGPYQERPKSNTIVVGPVIPLAEGGTNNLTNSVSYER